MKHLKLFSTLLIGGFILSGCSPNGPDSSAKHAELSGNVASYAPAALAEVTDRRIQADQNPPAQAQNYLAIKYTLTLQTEADQVQATWQSIQQQCQQTPNCTLFSSDFFQGNDYNLPRGTLNLRIKPDDKDQFFKFISDHAKIVANRMSTTDLSTEVIDTEARLANMTALRDRLRTLQASSGASLSDLLKIEETLTNTQSNIDSLKGQRAFLANETEKIEINLELISTNKIVSPVTANPITQALNQSVDLVAQTVGIMIAWLARLFPVILVVYIGYRLVRRRSKK